MEEPSINLLGSYTFPEVKADRMIRYKVWSVECDKLTRQEIRSKEMTKNHRDLISAF